MSRDIVKSRWAQLRGKLKRTWSKLTDDDLDYFGAHREYLVGKLQERYRISKEKAEGQVKEFERSLH